MAAAGWPAGNRTSLSVFAPKNAEHFDRRLASAKSATGYKVFCRASNEGYSKIPEDFTIPEKAPTQAFSWLKAPILALSHLRHYAKQT